MRARFIAYWDYLRGSYWFIPALMALGAVILALLLTALDDTLGGAWIEDVAWLSANKPDGARALLSTVAGSMITVAGVVFSITISAVVYASSQYGPRLLTNFMQDRGNQVTLGTFIATFLYCLLVLRTVRNGDDTGGAFVPHASILVGLVLALASLGVLIYFIHHTPASMHVSNVVAGIGRELHAQIDAHFNGDQEPILPAQPADLPEGFFDDAVRIRADQDGYLVALDLDRLLALAAENDLLLRLAFRPGDFATRGQTLLLAWPPANLDEERQRRLRQAFAWGHRRSQAQDVLFLADELVEVAARALSPGVNDPFTAMNCMDWLGGGLVRLAHSTLPDTRCYDFEGTMRMIGNPITFRVFVETACGRLRPYACADRNAALHMMTMLAEVLGTVENEANRRTLLSEARNLLRACREVPLPPLDLEAVEQRFRTAIHLAHPDVDPEAFVGRIHGSQHRR